MIGSTAIITVPVVAGTPVSIEMAQKTAPQVAPKIIKIRPTTRKSDATEKFRTKYRCQTLRRKSRKRCTGNSTRVFKIDNELSSSPYMAGTSTSTTTALWRLSSMSMPLSKK